jgi:acyl-coenzyme A synthetase/AMP-(fatty) acid ligase
VAFLGLNQDTVFCVFRLGAWTGSGYAWPATTWTVGGTVVFEQRLEAHLALMIPGITHAVLEPSTLAAILATPVGAFPRSDSMRLAVTGEAMTQNQIDQAKARITPLLFNYLGSTEAGGIALTLLESSEDQKWHKLVPNRVVEIVDEFDRRVPTGQIGRLRISTAGGPTGYLNDEAATRDFFKDGFFYTGDLAVMRADGRMALQGRFTDVINVGGLKISPAPVEERLSELFGASGVCLFSMPGDDDAEDIHVVVETATPIDSERLIAAVRRELPGLYQVRVHSVAALPRNQMGKIVRQAIRAEASARRPPSAGMTEPR